MITNDYIYGSLQHNTQKEENESVSNDSGDN